MLDADDQELRENLLRRLVDAKLMGPTRQILENCEPSLLPPRELPHGNIANLFLLFLAYTRVMREPSASKTVFYQEAKRWRACLRFHKRTVHSVCAVCSTLRSAIHNAKETLLNVSPGVLHPARIEQKSVCFGILDGALEDFGDHARLCDLLLGHYTQSWRDREVYWTARQRSQVHGDLVTVILDSYDKAKLMLPKFPQGRTPKKPIYETIRRIFAEQLLTKAAFTHRDQSMFVL